LNAGKLKTRFGMILLGQSGDKMTPEDFKIIVNGLIEDQVIYLKETDQSTGLPLCDWAAGLITSLEVVGKNET